MKIQKNLLIILFVFIPIIAFSQETINLKLSLREKSLPFGLIKKVPKEKPIVSLALSGGGSRAISHIGVLKAIEELKIPVDYIIGTSMGSVVGGLYSAGYKLEDLDSLITKINWEELFFVTGADRTDLFVDQKITEDKGLITIRLDGLNPVFPQSLNTGKKISNLLTSITMNAPINKYNNFDDFLYKYRAVATELVSGNRMVIKDGALSEAMRASSNVSFLLPPIKIDSMLLVDGGLVDNLPIKTAEELNPDYIIASDATSGLRSEEELIYPWQIADQLVTIPSRKLWEENKSKADILITQDLKKRKNDNFKNLDDVVLLGYNSSISKLQKVNSELKKQFLKNLENEDILYNNIQFSSNPNILEKRLAEFFANQSVIKKSELLYYLYSFYEEGIYSDISASIYLDSTSTIKINYELNSPVNSLNLTGVSLFPLDSVLVYFDGILNKPYNSENILNSILSLLRYYRDHDFMFATVDKIIFDEDNKILKISINEGEISDLVIEGNENTLSSIISREFPNISDNYLLKTEFDEDLQNLSATDLFDNIVVKFQTEDSLKNNLKLSLDEKLPNVLRVGLRIDNENFTQVAVDLRNENLFGTGSELGFSFSGGTRNISYVLEHKTNRIFDTYLTYKAQAFYKFNDVNQYKDDDSDEEDRFSRSRFAEYRQRFYGGFIGIGALYKKLGTLTAELKYERNEIDNIFSFQEENEYKLDISSLRFRLQIDSQNKYPFPTSGIYLNTFYETAQKFLGGNVSFARFSFDYSSFLTINQSHTIKPRIIFGFADETLPLSQQFNFGGQSIFAGYRDYEFRGRQIFISSLQYRYKLPFKIYFDTYIKLRYDIGSSWINQEKIRLDDLRHGIGLTVSFDTPIGPADFMVGRSLYLKDTSPKRILSRGPFMFYFTIGYYY
jgi:NTE family protein